MPGARKDASTLYPTGAYHHTEMLLVADNVESHDTQANVKNKRT